MQPTGRKGKREEEEAAAAGRAVKKTTPIVLKEPVKANRDNWRALD